MSKQITMQQVIEIFDVNEVNVKSLTDFLNAVDKLEDYTYFVKFISLSAYTITFEIWFNKTWLSDLTYSLNEQLFTEETTDRTEIKQNHKELLQLISELKKEQ